MIEEDWPFYEEDKNKEVLCDKCSTYSLSQDWTETEVYCELCGGHSAIECPNCGEVFDFVGSDKFTVK